MKLTKKIINRFQAHYKILRQAYNISNRIHQNEGKLIISTLIDIIFWSYKYRTPSSEYYHYKLYNKTYKERQKYMPSSYFCTQLAIKYRHLKSQVDVLDNKGEFNKKFNLFIDRDWLLPSESSYTDFLKFCKKNNTIVSKIQNSYGGAGVEKIDIKEDTDLESLFKKSCNNNLLLEECIIQHKDMSSICNVSVNTIRAETIAVGNEIKVVGYFIKVGYTSFADNFCLGGFVARINSDTGIVESKGIDKNGNSIDFHPSSGVRFEGFKIPFWDELKETTINAAKEAKKITPDITIIGWDIAITQEKPILVEGNVFPGVAVLQLLLQTGMKDIYEQAI